MLEWPTGDLPEVAVEPVWCSCQGPLQEPRLRKSRDPRANCPRIAQLGRLMGIPSQFRNSIGMDFVLIPPDA